jgi:hypothetical protein
MPKMGLVLQGGGALGAYEYGAITRLVELGWRPVAVTGVSIGGGHCGCDRRCTRWRHLCKPKAPVGGDNPFTVASLAGRQTGNVLDIRQSGFLANSPRFIQLHKVDELV